MRTNFNVSHASEDTEQENLFTWAAYSRAAYPELGLLFHVPNGGKRDKATAVKFKRLGVKAGVPDIFLPVARGAHHGLFVELKREDGGRTSEYQKEWIESLTAQGYAAFVCHGWRAATEIIQKYLQSGECING